MGYSMRSEDEVFNCTIWGMGRIRELMYLSGVLDCEHSHDQWPDKEDKDYNTKKIEILSSRSPNIDMVPLYKFYSNDSWIVHPDECLLIAEKVSEYLNKNPKYGCDGYHRDFYYKWVEFNKKTSSSGGYKVC